MVILFLVGRDFRQDRGLQPFFFFLGRVQGQTAGRDEARGDENNQIPFDVLIDISAEQPSNQRNVADDRDLIFRFLHVFPHQTAKHDRLAVPHAHIRRHFARAKNRLINHVLSEKNLGWSEKSTYWIERCTGIYPKDRTAVIDEAFKLDHLRHEVQVDGDAVRPHDWLNLEGHTGISSFKSLWCSRRHDRNCNRSNSATSARDAGHLRGGERGWITKFPDNFNHGALAAFGRHLRRGEKIDPFLLIQGANDDLKLRIRKNTSQPKNSRGYGTGSQ